MAPFLTYDVGKLLNWYRDETPALDRLPYVELDCFLEQPWEALKRATDLKVAKTNAPFRLASHPPDSLASHQDRLYDAFVKENRVDKFDSKNIRLDHYDAQEHKLTVRPCNYSDGLRSNYALDWHGKFSLRSLLAEDYGSRLPPLDDLRLSNALGLAVVVWSRTKDGDMLPYLPKRADAGLAVFPGGLFHCTASGNAEWKADADTFDRMFTADICQELDEEVGLSRADLEWIVPVALCREFLRGGKPQLFFAARANIGAEELARKRRAAIERQIVAGRQEVLDECLPVESLEQVYRDLARCGTIEAFANMCYAQRCAESAGRAGSLSLER